LIESHRPGAYGIRKGGKVSQNIKSADFIPIFYTISNTGIKIFIETAAIQNRKYFVQTLYLAIDYIACYVGIRAGIPV
jgi:hypothetical protein